MVQGVQRLCWWCKQRPADSGEHKIKQTRVAEEFSAGGDDHYGATLYTNDPNHPYPSKLRSPTSSALKFRKSLCRRCNSTRSQPFDNAYQHFWDWIDENREKIRKADMVDFSQVFAGEDFDQRDLARYYVKNVGCRFVENGYDVPDKFIHYLDDIDKPGFFNLVFYRDFGVFDAMMIDSGTEYRSPHTMPASIPSHTDPSQCQHYLCAFQEGYAGVLFHWRHNHLPAHQLDNLADHTIIPIIDRKGIEDVQWLFTTEDQFEYAIRKQINLTDTPW